MLREFSDIHIKVGDLPQSLVYPGPRLAPAECLAQLAEVEQKCEQDCPLDDFTLSLGHITWRGRRDRLTVDGLWYRLRKMPEVAPSLDTLPSPLPTMAREMLLAPSLTSGGLIYLCGGAGSGKTTTASATVVSRLQKFGGIAYTIEDPPEMPLNGWHGEGYCSQTSVAGETASDWAESFRGALRSQPASTHQILFVGEIRNAESAIAMLRAASNGFLVIATGFGTDVVSAVDALAKLTGANAATFANMLRLVLHQRLCGGQMQISMLASPSSTSPVAARIRAGQYVHLANDIEHQQIQMSRGINPLAQAG